MLVLLLWLRRRVGAIGGWKITSSFFISLGTSLVMYVAARGAALHLLQILVVPTKAAQLIAVLVGTTVELVSRRYGSGIKDGGSGTHHEVGLAIISLD